MYFNLHIIIGKIEYECIWSLSESIFKFEAMFILITQFMIYSSIAYLVKMESKITIFDQMLKERTLKGDSLVKLSLHVKQVSCLT